ncbi:MAG: hypothetical protein HYY01_00385 [Chloroflexi bacterium]|nr:hypothetical protein [Chloroflexota bacterium]
MDEMKEKPGPAEVPPPEVRYMEMELVWKCGGCGYLKPREDLAPKTCPDCKAPREEFYLLTED